jgi:hypothetical protein
VLLDDTPWIDGARVVVAVASVLTTTLYVRLMWRRARREWRGEYQAPWPKAGNVAVVLFLVVVMASSLGRRGEPLRWWTVVSWFAVGFAAWEARIKWQFHLRPPWTRHAPGGRRRRS